MRFLVDSLGILKDSLDDKIDFLGFLRIYPTLRSIFQDSCRFIGR